MMNQNLIDDAKLGGYISEIMRRQGHLEKIVRELLSRSNWGVTGTNVALDVTNFNRVLSGADADVQTAMETIDELAYEFPFATYSSISPVVPGGTYFMYLMCVGLEFDALEYLTAVACTAINDNLNYWTLQLTDLNGNNIAVIDTKTVAAASTWFRLATNTFTNSDITIARKGVYLVATSTGAPGNLYVAGPKLRGLLR